MNAAKTWVSCLTPPAAAAIAVLALRGPLAYPVVSDLFRPISKRPLPDQLPEAGTVWFGHFGGDGLADEVVVTINQITPQPWLEVHCHGGLQVVEWLIGLLEQRGLEHCSAAEFLAQSESVLRATALEQLARAPTARTASILLDQANGAMERALAEIHSELQHDNTVCVARRIDAILKHSRVGAHLVEPWRVVIAGASNVGKSSLVNALAGYQRSVVAPVPGTTRDAVSVDLAIDGWPVRVFDTAGLRDDAGGLEGEGITMARSVLAGADLILWVVDSTADPVWPDAKSAARNPLLIVNKIDLTNAWDGSAVMGAVLVSAQTGAGIGGLCEAISRRLVPSPPAAGEAVPFVALVIEQLYQMRTMALLHMVT